MDKDLNLLPNTIKLLPENSGNIASISIGDFLFKILDAQAVREKYTNGMMSHLEASAQQKNHSPK